MSTVRTTAVIVAAGRGERFGGEDPKQFLLLAGSPVLLWSARAFVDHPLVDEVVIVLPPEATARTPSWIPSSVIVVAGGETRADSVINGVAATDESAEVILVHDGVRPFVTAELISRVVASSSAEAIVPVIPVTDTVKTVDERGLVVRTPPRASLRRAQTPQGFPAELLRWAYASGPSRSVTDDALMVERAGCPVRTIPGDARNLKITESGDLEYARWLVDTGLIPAPTFG